MSEITITKTLTKSGESVVLIIPKDVADASDLRPNDLVEARIRKLKTVCPPS